MGNGTPLSPGKIILAAVSLSISINGIIGAFINSAINEQSQEIIDLRVMIFEKMDDRYRRFEAKGAHQIITNRIIRVEAEDDRLEEKIDSHVEADRRLHEKG